MSGRLILAKMPSRTSGNVRSLVKTWRRTTISSTCSDAIRNLLSYPSRGGADDVEDEAGLGEHGNVAAVGLVGGGAHALRNEAFQLRVDGVVLIGHDVPARLRLPGGVFGLGAEQVRVRHALGRPDQLLFLFGQVSREVLDAVPEHPDP